jgi:hypothetical protein
VLELSVESRNVGFRSSDARVFELQVEQKEGGSLRVFCALCTADIWLENNEV